MGDGDGGSQQLQALAATYATLGKCHLQYYP
jgi:hypothetical protein